MKKTFTTPGIIYALSLMSMLVTACQKNRDAANQSDDAMASITDASVSSTIAVVASASVATADSVYLLQPCQRGARCDSVAQTNLPAAVSAYLDAMYAGYTFNKAFAIKNSGGTVTGYVVVVYYNDKPVGIEFDGAGVFVKVLERRERGDLQGGGFHKGGRAFSTGMEKGRTPLL